MPNKESATHWLEKAMHNLTAAQILYRENHYTDIVGIELHQAIEKSLKSLLAYDKRKIKKTHDLIDLSAQVSEYIQFQDFELDILDIITNYYITEKYPVQGRNLPPKEEIAKVLSFAENLFNKVCVVLDIIL